jgi:hypothetical protein
MSTLPVDWRFVPDGSGFAAELIFFHVATSKMEEQGRFFSRPDSRSHSWNQVFVFIYSWIYQILACNRCGVTQLDARGSTRHF